MSLPDGRWYRIERTPLRTWNVIEYPWAATVGCYRDLERARRRVPVEYVRTQVSESAEEYREPLAG